ncbi:MAG TPA: multiheme c-type cytochrome [Candidatus Acidoferrales bacterium]|nr:multiheme c-type cytochrome [Candidatus Acidoferrales bacterium]
MRKEFAGSAALLLISMLLAGAARAQGTPATAEEILKLAANTSKESQTCITCHRSGAAPLVVQQWAVSRHAEVGIGCYECHQADKSRPDAFEHFGAGISVMVTPKSCGTCHGQEAGEFEASHHAQAGQILGSLDNVLGEDVEGPAAAAMGCAKCHGSVVKVVGKGKLDPATWPNEGIGRITRRRRFTTRASTA